ncbi:MAG TPA: DUF2169 domain-containing protein, partial [Acetobacteraceae bacterium]|nr:DUF2169 domain-containing protein [Acetobacteraceae bacterium]
MRIVNLTPFELLARPQQPAPPDWALTVVLKGTFTLKPDAPCPPAAKHKPIQGDETFLDEIGRSLRWADDGAPIKPHTDFYILGSFHQPGGVPAPFGRASFELGPLSKELLFFGPRFATPGRQWEIGPPAPVASVPLRWEFSFGGLSDPRNPLGRGIEPATLPDGSEALALPQIEYPEQRLRKLGDRPPPANFAPVPPGFESRLAKRGTYDQRWAVFRAPLPPLDFDPSYYNAAPGDQQAGNFPRGDETLILRNLHPSLPELRTRLPGVSPHAGVLVAEGMSASPQPVTMNLDTIVAMPEEDALVLVWRGVVPLRGGALSEEILWLQVELEETSAEKPPFAPLAARMLNGWQPAAAAPAAAPAAPPAEDEDVAKSLGEARKLLAGVALPPALAQLVAEENDPNILFDALGKHIEETLSSLESQLG